jgi:hypothetical protein
VYKLDVDDFRVGNDHDLDSRAEDLPAHRATIRLASPDGEWCDEFACTSSKIFALYRDRGTMVYDSTASMVAICPPLLPQKNQLLAIGHDIYALQTTSSLARIVSTVSFYPPSMEKLGPAPCRCEPGEWRCESLPPPPSKLRGTALCSATSRKKGFHSPPLVPNVFGPRLKGPSVPVHLKMWARGH